MASITVHHQTVEQKRPNCSFTSFFSHWHTCMKNQKLYAWSELRCWKIALNMEKSVKRKKNSEWSLCMCFKDKLYKRPLFLQDVRHYTDLITIIITLERGNILLMKRRSVSLSTVLDLSIIVLINYKRNHQKTVFKDDFFLV